MLSISLHPFPALSNQRVMLRRITEQDVPAIYRMRSEEAVMRYLDRPPAANENDALDYIKRVDYGLENNSGITWGIALQSNSAQLIGTIGFWRIDAEHHRAEIGYLILPEYQGQGLMQEALQTAIHFAFNTLHLHSIEANVNPANLASKKLLERNGFVQEAYFRENFFYNNQFLDSVIYSLIAREVGGLKV